MLIDTQILKDTFSKTFFTGKEIRSKLQKFKDAIINVLKIML